MTVTGDRVTKAPVTLPDDVAGAPPVAWSCGGAV
jgi:hypothetical protein